ncbi:hypothetical protein Tco_0748302 [Tanacetum coccineum]|uniref:Uncharacterized protein n=1 Tax=Tanacetum coccineum TaxID=301880 RepID=A0ABQ4YWF7_9ASTR
MPYPRFTKAIIHYFMGQHKSISKRKGSPYHIVDNDSRLDRLKFVAYKTFISISTGLIPPKIGRGKGAQGTKADVIPKKATVASKKKRPKKKVTIRDESSDEESDEQEERLIRSKPMGVVIHDTPQVSKKKSTDPSQKLKLKGIELLSDAAYGLSEGVGLGPEVLDEPTEKLHTQMKELTFPFDEKDEKVEDIPWVSTDDDEIEEDDEEDDTSIDIENTDDERMDIDVKDQVKGVAEMNISKEEEDENAEKVEEQNADE